MTITNNTKGQLLAFANAIFAILLILGVGTPELLGAILVAIDAGFVLLVGVIPGPLHYTSSPKRIPDSA